MEKRDFIVGMKNLCIFGRFTTVGNSLGASFKVDQACVFEKRIFRVIEKLFLVIRTRVIQQSKIHNVFNRHDTGTMDES